MSNLYTPATRFMSILSYRNKFTLFMVIILTSVALLAGPVIQKNLDSITSAHLRHTGIDLLEVYELLENDIARHRTATVDTLLGGIDHDSEALEKSIDKAFTDIKQIATEALPVDLELAKWRELEEKWQQLKLASFKKHESVEWYEDGDGLLGLFDAHAEMIRQLRATLKSVGYTTHVLSNNNLVQVKATDIAGFTLANYMSSIEAMTGIMVMLKHEGTFNPQSFIKISNAKNLNLQNLKQIEPLMKALAKKVSYESLQLSKLPISQSYKWSDQVVDEVIDADKLNLSLLKKLIVSGDELHAEWQQVQSALIHVSMEEIESDISRYQTTTVRYALIGGVLIGLMAYLLIGLYKGITQSINDLRKASFKMAEGDLSVRVTPTTQDEMREVANSFNDIAAQFEALIRDVKDSMSHLEQAVSEITTVASTTLSGMAEHHQEIDVMVAAMSEMSATAQDVEKNTVEAAGATREADQHTKEGELVVQASISNIQQLAEEVVRTSTAMEKLAEDANGIGAVTDVIRGIADQTNLLALNAAIEAARAGELGRGFAVVADEVRTLAQRTRESTDEIQTMINALQGASMQVLEVINASRDRVDESVEKVCQAGQSLESITGSVENVNCMNEQIASAATQQASTADELTNNMSRVRGIAEQASEGANSLVVAADQLESLSKSTSERLAKYKVS